MFPLSARDAIQVTCGASLPAAEVIGNVAQEIRKWRPSTCEVLTDGVRFKGGLLRFVASTNLLVAVTHGSVTVARNPNGIVLQYELSFVQLVVCATILVLWICTNIPANWALRGLLFVVFWLWFVGGNYLSAQVGFRALLRRSVPSAASREQGK